MKVIIAVKRLKLILGLAILTAFVFLFNTLEFQPGVNKVRQVQDIYDKYGRNYTAEISNINRDNSGNEISANLSDALLKTHSKFQYNILTDVASKILLESSKAFTRVPKIYHRKILSYRLPAL